VLGKRIEDFRWVYDEDTPQVRAVSRDLETGATARRVSANRNYRKDGSVAYCEWHNSSLRDESGQLRSILSLVLDVTDRKRMEDQLRDNEDRLRQRAVYLAEANRVKDQFLATLSHELRTPLNAIVGWSQMLVDGYIDPSMVRRAVEAIARNARAQVMLIDDVLDVSRIVSGKLRLDLRPTDIGECLQHALDSVRPAADAKRIRILVHRDPDVIVAADPDRIQQIMWNLLSNAVKFTPEGGEVGASVRRADSHVELEVRDNGGGIPPEMLSHMFERFWQADRSTTRKHGGLGLGLAIVRHLVELHGGQVTAESGGDGQGATFRVTFPIAVAAAAECGEPAFASDPAATARPRLRGLKVIVVDDEPDGRDLLETMLHSFGAEVRTAPDSSSGLAAVRVWRPDVVLSDIGMPGEDGYSFIRRLRALPAEEGGMTPAAALTAYGGPDDRLRTIAAGYQQHVTKPVMPEQLAAVVAALGARVR
jgi:signal transduction histidine kinase/ActR/RegA family two-component response regulator